MSANIGVEPDITRRITAGSVLARSVLLNIVGQTVPLVIGLLVTPFIVRRLGSDGFGVLSLGWTILTLSLVFNLGIGRATTKFAAEYLAREETTKLPSLFWMSVVLNIALGLVATALVASASLWLIRFGVLKIPAALTTEAEAMFIVIALALPFTFITTTLRGMLEARQHFAEISWARLVFTTAVFIVPAVALIFSPHLGPIAWLLTVSRIAETVAYAWLCFRSFPLLRSWAVTTSHLRQLFVYSGWLTVTNVLAPLILNMDRFIIGSLLSVRAVAYFAVPADLVIRLTALPSSVIVPLFPAFAALSVSNDRARVEVLYARSVKYVALSMACVVGIVIAFARPFLFHWLGAEFADNSSLVMQIMAVGILVNSVAFLPYTVLQAVGRPDLTAKCHLVETPISVALMWLLTKQYGIAGTAVAWTARVALDWILLTAITVRLRYLSATTLSLTRCAHAAGLVMLFLAGATATSFVGSLPLRVALTLSGTGVWAAVVAMLALDDVELRWLRLLPRKVGLVAA